VEIIEYFETDRQADWTAQIERCDWGAAKLLAKLLGDPAEFVEVLGENGRLFLLREGDELISFATLTKRECIRNDDLFPWIGFVHTAPEHRGNRYSGIVIDHACVVAKELGYGRVYIATERAGAVYRKYGFLHWGWMADVFGVENEVLCKVL